MPTHRTVESDLGDTISWPGLLARLLAVLGLTLGASLGFSLIRGDLADTLNFAVWLALGLSIVSLGWWLLLAWAANSE